MTFERAKAIADNPAGRFAGTLRRALNRIEREQDAWAHKVETVEAVLADIERGRA